MTPQQVARIVVYDSAIYCGSPPWHHEDTSDRGERNVADIASSIGVNHRAWQLYAEPNYGGVRRSCHRMRT